MQRHLFNKTLQFCFSIILISGISSTLCAQDYSSRNWDNQAYLTNRVSFGHGAWRYTGEIQVRFEDNVSSLQNWHFEGIASYLAGKKWEIVPDFRYTRTPERSEYRPGFGTFYKLMIGKAQLVQQVKYQWDFESTGYFSHGPRYAFFYNLLPKENILISTGAGALWEFGQNFNGLQGFRALVAVGYIFDEVNTINIGYMAGFANSPGLTSYFGIITLGFRFNLEREFDYVPARYISF